MKKTWLTAKEISQFGYCPEQWRLTRLNKQGLVEVDKEKRELKLTRFKEGREYHAKLQVKPAFDWRMAAAVGVGLFLVLAILWTVIK